MAILILIGAFAAIWFVNYFISSVLHKGADAINNAMVDNKNKSNPPKEERLADRFKKEE